MVFLQFFLRQYNNMRQKVERLQASDHESGGVICAKVQKQSLHTRQCSHKQWRTQDV